MLYCGARFGTHDFRKKAAENNADGEVEVKFINKNALSKVSCEE
jgi:hypothetical protein